ncbi:hypothetical protein [Poseidonibacter sp.]|uniref:hypothetical protein n=1 Tax=Poseidonibacter sp. TaxID=2321188 RepID=UPI003C78547A
MIKKLYDFKKTQTDQKLAQRAQLSAKIERIDAEILLTQNNIDTTSVQRFGAISDFTILTMHKNTMKMHISKLEKEKDALVRQIDLLIKEIIESQKETEQYAYILEEEKQEALRKMLAEEEEASSEYVQSKYISR